MKHAIEKYKKRINQIVEKSFPDLKKKKIKLFLSEKGFYAFSLPYYFIGITKECENLKNIEMNGILVHELCHLEQYKKMGFFKGCLYLIYYFLSPKFKMKIEIEANINTIKKGYAKELLAITNKIKSELSEKEKYYGLSPKQIKLYSRKYKK